MEVFYNTVDDKIFNNKQEYEDYKKQKVKEAIKLISAYCYSFPDCSECFLHYKGRCLLDCDFTERVVKIVDKL